MLNVARILFILATVLMLTACEQTANNPTDPSSITTVKADQRGPTQPGQAFMADLQAAYDATQWERVEFQEVTRGGSQLAFPKCFPFGEYLQLRVNLQRGGPREVPPVEIYVPSTMQTAPGRCVVFRIEGTVADAEYAISTFLPVWYDELDLGSHHHTYELVTLADGTTYYAKGITRFDTPPTPWSSAPVEFTLLPHDPARDEESTMVLDPGDPGDD